MVEEAPRAQVLRVAGHRIQVEEDFVHSPPLGVEHALPQILTTRSDRRVGLPRDPARHAEQHLEGRGIVRLRMQVEEPCHHLVERVIRHRVDATEVAFATGREGVQVVEDDWVIWEEVPIVLVSVLGLPCVHSRLQSGDDGGDLGTDRGITGAIN